MNSYKKQTSPFYATSIEILIQFKMSLLRTSQNTGTIFESIFETEMILAISKHVFGYIAYIFDEQDTIFLNTLSIKLLYCNLIPRK